MRVWIVAAMLLLSTGAPACSCSDRDESLESTMRRELITSVAIIEARVVKEKIRENDEGDVQVAKLEVVRVWKGKLKPGDVFYSRSTAESAACGMTVSVGESFLVFRGSNQYHEFMFCGVDVEMRYAAKRIEIIERLLPEYSE